MDKRFTVLNAAEALEFSREGFASGRSVIFQAGVFNYRTFELGLPFDFTEDGIVPVYYSEEEIRRALPSFDNNTITNEHPDTPDGLVDVTNYEYVAQGELGTGATLVNGQVEAIVHLKGRSVVADMLAGKRDLSIGLSMSLVLEGGTAPDGTRYAARGEAIAGNHCALVDRGRVPGARVIGGDDNDDAPSRILLNGFPSVDRELPKAPLTDENGTTISLNSPSKIKESKMKPDENKTVVIPVLNGDITVPADVADSVKTALNSLKENHKSEVDAIVANHETVLAAEAEKVATLTEEKAALEAQNTPEAIALNAAERVTALSYADMFGVKVQNADTATTHNLNVQVLNGSNHPEASSFTDETPVAVVNAALSGMAAMLPKVENPLKNKVVLNGESVDDIRAKRMARFANPKSNATKGQ